MTDHQAAAALYLLDAPRDDEGNLLDAEKAKADVENILAADEGEEE